VDDDRALLALLAEALGAAGLAIDLAASGSEGLAAVERHAPAVILLDLRLPDMVGTEFMRRCRQLPSWRGAAVILITATDNNSIPRTALDEERVAVTMSKPLNIEGLVRLVAELVWRHPTS
jgi:CheY-like chemotaxis protein